MTTARIGLLAGACLTCAAGAGQAEGFSVTNFGPLPDVASCMDQAEAAVTAYRERFGDTGSLGRSDWTLGGYDLGGGTVDALFVCADEAGRVEPFLVVYAPADGATREDVAGRLGAIWAEMTPPALPVRRIGRFAK
jgi:hypothetical protein